MPLSLPARWAASGALLILGIMVFFSYSNTFHAPPYFDDFHAFVYEPLVKSSDWSLAKILVLSQTKFGWKRWIPMLTFSFDMTVGGGRLASFHLSNLTFHFLTSLAVFFLIRSLASWQAVRAPANSRQPAPWHVALWTAGLWVLHPVQTNAVTYLVQRMASLVTLFSVLSVAFYVIARTLMETENGKLGLRAALLMGGSLICMGFAFLCKQNSFILPVLLLFTEAWFFRTDTFHRILVFGRKHYVITTMMALALALLCYNLVPDLLVIYEKRHFTLAERVMTEWRVLAWYVSLLLWPSPNRLSLEHDVVISTSLVQPITTLFSLLFLVVIVTWIFSRRKRYPLITYGLLWFLLNLVIESTIIPLELVFEHRLYLSSIGFIFSSVLFISQVLTRSTQKLSSQESQMIAWSVFAMVAAALALLTFQRNMTWADRIAFNRDNVAKAPLNPRAHGNLAVALSMEGAYAEAIQEANTALNLGQKNFESYSVAANAIIMSYFGLKEYQKGVDEGQRLIAGYPPGASAAALPFACLGTALAYKELGQLSEAYQTVLRALFTDEHMATRSPVVVQVASGILADLYEKAKADGKSLDQDGNADFGKMPVKTWVAQTLLVFDCYSQAKTLLQESLGENPQDSTARGMLENVTLGEERSQLEKERWSFWRKYVLHPYSRFNLCMAAAYLAQTTNLPAVLVQPAEKLLDYALTIHPNSADATLLKGWYHFQRNETAQAIALARKTLELEPDSARAWLGLGFFLAKAGENREAIAAFHAVLELYPLCPTRPAIKDFMNKLELDPASQRTWLPNVPEPQLP